MRGNRISRITAGIYLGSLVLVCLHSFTQIDLSLTLSRVSLWQTLQQQFQQVGFYQRPWSTALYVTGITGWIASYVCVVILSGKKRLKADRLWQLIGLAVLISLFAFPAYSYDIYNYLFTAKTVLVYRQNPYEVIPMQFAGIDPWLSFLRWTHLPSAYSPLWIILTLPLYAMGLGKLLPEILVMKIFLAAATVLTGYFLWKILRMLAPGDADTGLAMFLLNPLVLMEGVLSPHNDTLMMALALAAFFVCLKKRPFVSFLLLGLSGAVKTMTVFLFPAVLVSGNRRLALAGMTVALVAGFLRKELLPWYMLWWIPFAVLDDLRRMLFPLVAAATAAFLLRYAPLFWYGEYSGQMKTVRDLATGIPMVCAMGYYVFLFLRNRLRQAGAGQPGYEK